MKYSLHHGKSQFLSLRAVHKAIKNAQEENKGITIQTLEADNIDPSSFADIFLSSGLFSTERILFIKRIYKNKEKDILIQFITEYLEKETNNDIVIIWEDQKIRSTTKYLKFFKEDNNLTEHDQLNKRTFQTWLNEELKEQELNLNIELKKILASSTNYDPERCSQEILKLKLLDEEITKEKLIELTSDTLEMDIWGLIDSINQNDKPQSLEILERLIKQNNDPNYILAMLARNLRLLTLTKYLVEQGADYKEIASKLRVPPFTVPSMINATKNQTDEKIKTMYDKFTNLDLQIKTGKIDGNLGLTLLCSYI